MILHFLQKCKKRMYSRQFCLVKCLACEAVFINLQVAILFSSASGFDKDLKNAKNDSSFILSSSLKRTQWHLLKCLLSDNCACLYVTAGAKQKPILGSICFFFQSHLKRCSVALHWQIRPCQMPNLKGTMCQLTPLCHHWAIWLCLTDSTPLLRMM